MFTPTPKILRTPSITNQKTIDQVVTKERALSAMFEGSPTYESDQTSSTTQSSNKSVAATQGGGLPFMTASRPIFIPTKNLDFNCKDEEDFDYDPFVGLYLLCAC